jgi:hypothetical protein
MRTLISQLSHSAISRLAIFTLIALLSVGLAIKRFTSHRAILANSDMRAATVQLKPNPPAQLQEPRPPATPVSAKQRAIDAAANLAKHSDGFSLDESPDAVPALNALWVAMQAWAVDYLNRHPKATPHDVEADAPIIDPDNSFKAASISPGLYGISVRYLQIGNVFLVGQHNSGNAVLWDIRNSEPPHTLIGWNTKAARPCSKCRAAYGEIHPLPADNAGNSRFYVDGGYAQEAGAAYGKLLSIWVWNGKTAQAALRKDYAVTADDEELFYAGNLIKITVKDEYRMMFSCGACSGRQLHWTIRIGRDRVDDLGLKPDIPEMDTVDEVFFRLWKSKPATSLAAPPVLAKMKAIVDHARKLDQKNPDLGLLTMTTVEQRKGSSILTVSINNEDALQMRFTVERKNGGFYLSRLENEYHQ